MGLFGPASPRSWATDEARPAAVVAKGTRLDETPPGSGLGLAIAGEPVGLDGGVIRLETAPASSVRVELTQPVAA